MSELSIAESIKQDYEERINKQAKVIQWYEDLLKKDEKRIKELEEGFKASTEELCEYAEEIERLHSIIKEVREYIENNWISQKDADNYRFDDEELNIEISDIAVLYDILDKEKDNE